MADLARHGVHTLEQLNEFQRKRWTELIGCRKEMNV